MTPTVAVVIPVLQQPQRAQPVVDSIMGTTDRARIVFVCSPGDIPQIEACHDTGQETILSDRGPGQGDWAHKINLGYRHTTEPLILLGADDLLFHPDWVEAAEAAAKPGVGVIGTNDLGNPRVIRGEHATHPIVTRDYADRFGTIDQPGLIAHEGYWHEFVDDEIVGTAKHRGAWVFAYDCVIEHLHPNWGKAPTDHLYDQRPLRFKHGRRVFDQRRHLWT